MGRETNGLRTEKPIHPNYSDFPLPRLLSQPVVSAGKKACECSARERLGYRLSLPGAVWHLFKRVMIFQLQPKRRVMWSMHRISSAAARIVGERMPCVGLFYGDHLPEEGGRSDAARVHSKN